MMRFPRWLLLLLLYSVAVFAWIVFFEHGPGWDRFWKGADVEVRRAWETVQSWWSARRPAA